MINILLQYLIFEKAIGLLFDKVNDNFPRNFNKYSSVMIKINKSDNDIPTFATFYDVEIKDSMNPKSVMIKYRAFRFYKHEREWMLDDSNDSIVNNPVIFWYEIPKSFIKFKKKL